MKFWFNKTMMQNNRSLNISLIISGSETVAKDNKKKGFCKMLVHLEQFCSLDTYLLILPQESNYLTKICPGNTLTYFLWQGISFYLQITWSHLPSWLLRHPSSISRDGSTPFDTFHFSLSHYSFIHFLLEMCEVQRLQVQTKKKKVRSGAFTQPSHGCIWGRKFHSIPHPWQ